MGDSIIPSKQRLRGIERLEIEPRDFDETVRFWRRLGFQVTIKGEVGRREAALRAGELRLLFREPRDEGGQDRRRSPFRRLRIAFGVRDLEALVAELREKGVEVPAPGRVQGLARAVEIVDPNGIRLLLEEGAV